MQRERLSGAVIQLFHSRRTGIIHGDDGYDVTFNAESLAVEEYEMRSKGSITQLLRNQRPDSLEAADFRAISVGDLVVYGEQYRGEHFRAVNNKLFAGRMIGGTQWG